MLKPIFDKISIKKIVLTVTFLFYLSSVFANDVFSFKIAVNNVLNHNQAKALSLLNSVLSGIVYPEQNRIYSVKYDTIQQKDVNCEITGNTVIFYKDPDLLLNERAFFKTISLKLIANALKVKEENLNAQKINWILTAAERHFTFLKTYYYIPLKASFPFVHYLVISEIKLSPELIMDTQLYRTCEFSYDMYSELCDILLLSITGQKNGRKILSRYIKANNIDNDDSSVELLCNAFANNTQNKKNTDIKKLISDNLNEAALKYAVNSYMPADTKFALKAFKKANQIQYQLKDEKEKIQVCSLKDITNEIDNMESPVKEMNSIVSQFLRLESYFPYFMRQALQEIIYNLVQLTDIIQKGLLDKKNEEIQEKIDASIIKLYDSAEKQKELDKAMFLSEIKNFSTFTRFDRQFKIIENTDRNSRKLYPELNAYLDKLDETFK